MEKLIVKPKYYVYPGIVGANKDVALKQMNLSNEFIIKKVCQYYKVEIDRVMSKRRFREITIPRQVAQYFMKRYTEQNLSEIGIVFDRDHTTVIHSIEVVQDLIDTDNVFFIKQDGKTFEYNLRDDIESIKELFFVERE